MRIYLYLVTILSLLISCKKIQYTDFKILKLSNDEVNSLNQTYDKINSEFQIRLGESNSFGYLASKKLFGYNKFQSDQHSYQQIKYSYNEGSKKFLAEEKQGLNYSFSITNNFNENIDELYFTTQIIFEFPNGIKTYVDNFKANDSLWKINEKIYINKNSIINFAKNYESEVFKNHTPTSVNLKIYAHAKNNVGFQLNKDDKYYFVDNGHIENEVKITGEKIIDENITNLWKEQNKKDNLFLTSLEDLTYLTPNKLIPLKTNFSPNVKSFIHKDNKKVIIQYSLNLIDPKDPYNNYDMINYESLEGFMKNYIMTLGNVSNFKLWKRQIFETNSYYDDTGSISILGSFSKNNKRYITIAKSFYNKNTTKVNSIFMIYPNNLENRAEIFKIINSITVK